MRSADEARQHCQQAAMAEGYDPASGLGEDYCEE
jgi:hypothetical protein